MKKKHTERKSGAPVRCSALVSHRLRKAIISNPLKENISPKTKEISFQVINHYLKSVSEVFDSGFSVEIRVSENPKIYLDKSDEDYLKRALC